MSQVIIFQPASGPLAIFTPSPGVTVSAALGAQITPKGLPFKIIDASEVPTDKTFRAVWEWDGDLSTDNDGVGS